MRVLIVNSFFYPDEVGGAEKSVRITAAELVRMGHDVLVVTLSQESRRLSVDGVQVIGVPLANFYFPSGKGEGRSSFSKLAWHALDTYNPVMSYRLKGIVEKYKPSVIHTNNLSGFSTSAWAVAGKLGIPVVHTTRDFYLLCPKGTMLKNGNACSQQCGTCRSYSVVRKSLSKGVAHVVGISDFMLRRHRRYGFFDGVEASVIFNPYLPEACSIGSDIKADEDRLARWRIGFIGRLDRAKGVEMLLDACTALVVKGIDVSLTVAGEGTKEYEELLTDRSRGLGARVRFLGKVEASSFYRDIDLLVVPSVWDEPLGRVVLEAFAYGLPVVATPVGGLPEITKGYAGIVCDDVSAPAVAHSIMIALDRLEADPRRVGEAALAESKRYAPEYVARRYLSVYTDVVEAANA